MFGNTMARCWLAGSLAIGLIALSGWVGCSQTPPDASPSQQAGQQQSPPQTENQQATEDATMSMTITSTAFAAGERIPVQHTGEGQDVSPALNWTNVPAGTAESALICDDPDAPTAEPWVHWVICKIPATATGLSEGIPRKGTLNEPAGALQGRNSWNTDNIGYRGPMPPLGHGTHHYHFKLYALDATLSVTAGLTKAELLSAMTGHILAEAKLIGTYER